MMNVAHVGASGGSGLALPCRLTISLIVWLTIPWVAMTADADPLSSYRWSARPLIVFAEDESDTNLQTMRQALTRDHCEVADRDMVIIEVLEQSAGSAGAQPIDASVAALLRHKFHIKEGTFGVILVGKDGGEKFRTSEPPVLDEIFMLIDGMPMRRREIKFTGAGCEA